MQSVVVSFPSQETSNVLIFLHGVGESFIPVDGPEEKILYSAHPGELVKKPGLENLFNHGVPKILKKPGEVLCHTPNAGVDAPPFSHPVLQKFVTIAPQTFLREDLADEKKNKEMMDRICKIVNSVVSEPKIAIMGFSRGGFAALRLGTRPEVRAIVTMDAVAKGKAVQQLGPSVEKHTKPFWAFFADYPVAPDNNRKERITEVHRNLAATQIEDFTKAPTDKRCKTVVATYGSQTDRHNQVCNAVSNCPAVYEWIASRLQDA